MKQWKSLVIMGAALAVLVLAVVLASVLGKPDDGNGDTPTPVPTLAPVLSLAEADVTAIRLANENAVIDLQPTIIPGQDGAADTTEWKILTDRDLPWDSSSIKTAVSLAINIRCTKEIGTDVAQADLAQYGLDAPKSKVQVTDKTGKTYTVLFGDNPPADTDWYCMLEGTSRVCITNPGNGLNANKTYLAFLQKTVFDMTMEEIVGFDLLRARDNLEYRSVLEFDDEEDQYGTWMVLSPVQVEANTEGVPTLVSQLAELGATEYVELDPDDLAEYGLDAPAYTFRLKDKEGAEVTLQLGKGAGSGTVYALSSRIPAVFKMGTAALTAIDKPLVELVNRFVYLASIWEVAKIDFQAGDFSFQCEIDDAQGGDDENAVFKVDGKDAKVRNSSDDLLFRRFYQSIISVMVSDIEADATPEDRGDIRMEYTMKSGDKDVLTFSEKDEYNYYVFRNGTYTGLVATADDFYSSARADDLGILPAHDAMMTAIENAVDGVYDEPTPTPG